MDYHPVPAVLDTNHDGEISTGNIRNVPGALILLDHNSDDRLTEDELLPTPRDDR